MTRLIDADALKASLEITGTAESCKGCKHEYREWSCCADDIPTNYVCEQIDEAPTVDAIPSQLTKEEIKTIRIHMNAFKEKLCNQHRYKEAEDYQQIVDKLDTMMDAERKEE